MNKHPNKNRRDFLRFLGVTASTPFLANCASTLDRVLAPSKGSVKFRGLPPGMSDDLELAPGLNYQRVLTWGDPLNQKGEKFGYNNDYIALFPRGTDRHIIWVNHESVTPIYITGWTGRTARTKADVELEMKEVGGTLAMIEKKNGKWNLLPNHAFNRRLDAYTPIKLDRPILGTSTAQGTLANCAGGVTPWGTVLTCEENFDHFYGNVTMGSDGSRELDQSMAIVQWCKVVDLPPEHYGWVVEVNPETGDAVKRTSLGRFAHECATTTVAPDGRVVVYTGDDKEKECLYKFISAKPGSLEHGTLYVANTERGEWIPLSLDLNLKLREVFKTQDDVLVYTRQAAALVGGTPLNRPEDIEIHPTTKDVYISLTNSKARLDFYGSILRLRENGGDPTSLKFTSEVFLAGGPKTGFACPDNLAFDRNNNLWMTCDVAEQTVDWGPYRGFGNNSLFCVPASGPDAGRAVRVANAPMDAEFTGPCFTPDQKTLFLSVQHPGQKYQWTLGEVSSHWPLGGDTLPRPAVVAIEGTYLDEFTAKKSLIKSATASGI